MSDDVPATVDGDWLVPGIFTVMGVPGVAREGEAQRIRDVRALSAQFANVFLALHFMLEPLELVRGQAQLADEHWIIGDAHVSGFEQLARPEPQFVAQAQVAVGIARLMGDDDFLDRQSHGAQ